MANATKARRKGAPAWLMTFADLMALLFALFVLILSFSEVDSDSFKKNAGPIAAAFNQALPTFVPPIEKSPQSNLGIPQQTDSRPEISSANDTYLREVARNKIINLVKSSVSSELANNLLELVVEENRIIMRFPAHSAFRAGDANLSSSIIPTMDQIADILARTEGKISVTGHTDNSPISTTRFRSNWELSTARAVSVIHRILRHRGLDPKRLTATGRADIEPLVENNSVENKIRNRRVEIAVEIPTSVTAR
jgi:chemotaxis protein MotB